jgi:hypothetical protein
MALVNPNIAMSYRPTTEYQPRNALAEYAQIQQIVGGQRQAEMADLQLEKYRQDRATLDTIRQAIVAKGGPPDLETAADAMIKSGKPEYLTQGMAIRDSLRNQRMFETAMQRYGYAETTPAAAAPRAAPAAAPTALGAAPAAAEPTAFAAGYQRDMAPVTIVASTPPRARQPIVGPRGELLGYESEAAPASIAAPAAAPAATNALAGPAAAPAATNALAAAPAGKTADQLRQEILAFSSSTDPRAKAMVDVLKTQLAELTKTHTVGGQIVSGAGRVLYTAPSQISAIEAEIAALKQENVADTDPRIATRQGKIAQLSGAGTPLDITRAMAERDRLIKAGRSPTDPDVQALNNFIRKQTTHQPAAQQNVYAYTPASETAQAEYMKGARTTFDALKNAPATLKNIDAAKALVPGAAGFMGAGGEPLLKAASFLNNRFGMSISTQGVTDATELRSRLFAGVIENLRKLDAQPTQAQQQALQDAIGNLGTDPSALPRVLDAMAQSVRDKVDLYNKDVTSAETRGVRFPYKPQIELPPTTPAPGAAAAQIPGSTPARTPAAGNTVTLPDGRVMTFPSADAAAKFRKDARLP